MAIVIACGTGISASAQDASADGNQVVSVYERSRPDYSASGVRSGSFLFNPTIAVTGSFNSNIYAQESSEVDDFITRIKPGFTLNSDWNNNYFSIYGNADIAKYADRGREDYEDFNIGSNGRIDISRDTSINLGARYSYAHEDRGSPDATGPGARQTFVDTFEVTAGFVRDLALVSLAIDAQYTSLEFSNESFPDSFSKARDRERYSGKVRVGYEIDQYYEAFVRVAANRVEYDDSKANGGPQRNSDGYEIVAGAAFDLTGTSTGEFFGGYISQSYDSDTLAVADIGDFTYGASLLWNPTGLTSVRGTVSRTVTETIVSGVDRNGDAAPAAGILGTLFDLQLEHELQRNILLKGTATYIKQNFENTVRDDDLFNATLGASYLLNRNFSLNANYTFNYRDTTAQGQDFKRHIFMVGLTAKW